MPHHCTQSTAGPTLTPPHPPKKSLVTEPNGLGARGRAAAALRIRLARAANSSHAGNGGAGADTPQQRLDPPLGAVAMHEAGGRAAAAVSDHMAGSLVAGCAGPAYRRVN